ncbi:MAG: PDZ domain-containing protein [Ignavibacteriales bacterium]|nr:PDZ domain-containing protein [Ignavibacteriales bacterium]
MKNPFDSMSARSIRGVYTLLMLVVLAVVMVNFVDVMFLKTIGNDQCAWRPIDGSGSRLLVTDVVPGGVSDKAGVKNGDILLAVNGTPFKTSQEAQQRINAVTPGNYATYVIQRGDQTFETKVEILRVVNMPYLSQFLLGFGFLMVGYVVVMSRPQGKIQRRFARYSLIMMLFFGLSTINVDPAVDSPWKLLVLAGGFFAAHFFAPSVFTRMFFHFPVHIAGLDKRWVGAALYVIGALVCLPFVPFLGGGAQAPVLLIRSAIFISYTFYFVGLAIFIYSYFKRIDKNRQKQLRPILIGIGIGWIAFTYSLVIAAWDPFVLFLKPVLLLPGILIPVVPIFFGYSIFRYRLMDIDLVIRRSLLYSIVTAVIATLYVVIVYGVGNFIAYAFGTEENSAVNLVALAAIAFTFDPLKQRIQRGIDLFFYRERQNYQKALLDFSR